SAGLCVPDPRPSHPGVVVGEKDFWFMAPTSLVHPRQVSAPSPAVRALRIEAAGLKALEAALEGDMRGPFEAALDLIVEAKGRVVVTGMGKSGHIGAKVAATLASTGTPAFFVHPAE